MSHDSHVTDSTEHTFSDKLLMFHIAALNVASIGNYGDALLASPRRDLALTYTRLMGEVELYAEDGANITIDNGSLEQPPMAEDRKQLAKHH
ncbi:DUF3231 family protein [Alicyclobacillus tolerans]|uniref:DUF3231 family protein n=1 Tax=Alicyclobacillus tolerans TaxID=90970 RepID=UPI001F1AC867|nr:DUF3231 family protein [Alicyclobacillus tolerans]MCF8568136.1 DUF3231 family protein [Alicyclobacillus tolerans]